MGRQTQRRIAKAPQMEHLEVLRNSGGSVQMTNATASKTAKNSGTTALTTMTSFTLGLAPETANLLFTSATVKVSKANVAATTTTSTLSLLRRGTKLTTAKVTGTNANVTSSTSNTLTSPTNNPTYTLKGKVPSTMATLTATVTVKREKRLVTPSAAQP